MEESTVSIITEVILGKIGYAAALVSEKDELKALEETISRLKYILVDAEKKQDDNPKVKAWLEKLENLLYEADDLMDVVYNEATNHKVEEWQKLNPKIKSIKEKLAARDDAGRNLNLEERPHEEPHKALFSESVREKPLELNFLFDDGRKKQKNDIKQLLLKDRDNGEEEHHLAAVAIVGYGGLGKTDIAKSMLGSSEFENPFEVRAMVHVPYDDSNIELLVRRIIRSASDNIFLENLKPMKDSTLSDDLMSFLKYREATEVPDLLDEGELHEKLRKVISGKRLLLVLDDVWNMDSEMWKEFKGLFSDAGPGSRILITTRSKFVANNVTSRPEDVYMLSNLDGYYSRTLFKNHTGTAFKRDISSEIEEIEKEIVEKCGGNPLAIATVGNKLKSINLETKDWSKFRDEGFLEVMKEEVLPSLKLSYDVLRPHLKHCFAYCGVFPQQSEIDVKTLIHLWMAQGLICPLQGQRVEDVGYEYFQDLFQRSLFDAVEVDPENGSVTKCKMPNLLQDIAVQLAAGTTKSLAVFKQHEKHVVDGRTQHVSFYFHLGSSWRIPTSFLQAKRIRTFVLPSQLHWETEGRLSHTTFETLISNCKGLRALDLHNTGIQKVPKSIDKLKYLRYLDLSQNSAIKSLPNSITNIPYLMTLKLSSCYGLEELPRDMKKLVHLKHLEIDWCYSLTHMPPGLGQLTQLETLSEFVVKNDTELKELAGLSELRGELKIQNLRNDMDSGVANLEDKKHLRSLILAWDVNIDSEQGAERTLQGLKPHSNLKELALFGYWGTSAFPAWLISLRNLVKFSLQKCKCRYLPPLSQLSSLKVLTVDEMDKLEYISNESDQLLSSSSTVAFVPSLEELRLTELPNLEGWWGGHVSKTATSLPSFPRLSKLIIEDCPKLRSMPLYPNLEEWLVLDNTSLETFIQTINDGSSSSLSQLKTLSIVGIKDTSFNDDIKWGRLTSLRFLRFDYLPKVKELPERLKKVTTLEELHIWRCDIETLPDWIKNLKSLKRIGLSTCPYLKSLPYYGFDRSLKTLKIVDCPILFQRCQKQTGADWKTVEGIENLLLQ